MQQKTILTIAITAVLTTLCICLILTGGIGLGLGLTGKLDTLVATSVPPATAVLAHKPPERPLARGQLLWQDDFSRRQWAEHNDNDHRKGYADEQYFIAVEVSDYSFWSVSGNSYQDFVLEVDTIRLEGPENNDYGLVLRYQNDANFYSFEISSDGFYTFTKLVEGELYEIIPWQQSEAVHLGSGHNTLRVEAVGANFTFYINDELVDAAIDSEFAAGDIGLVAGTYQETGTHIAFDNLKVWGAEK